MGLGIYIYIWLEAPLIPVSSEYQHVHAITTQEHSRHSPLPVDVLNLRQGQVLVKLVFLSITIRHVGAQTVSDESSASSSRPTLRGGWKMRRTLFSASWAQRCYSQSCPQCLIWQALMPPQHLAQHFSHAHGLQLCPALNARRRRSGSVGNRCPPARNLGS